MEQMIGKLHKEVMGLLQRVYPRPSEIAEWLEQECSYIVDLVQRCSQMCTPNATASNLQKHLKQLLKSQNECQLHEYLAEFQWADAFLQKGLSVRFGGPSEPDLFVTVRGTDAPIEVYAPHEALASVHDWHDRVRDAFLAEARTKCQYGLYPEANPGGTQPPAYDPKQLGIFYAQVADAVQSDGNEILYIYTDPAKQRQLDSSQVCVVRVPEGREVRLGDSVSCSIAPELNARLPCAVELRDESFECGVPKCLRVNGLEPGHSAQLMQVLNDILGQRQCSGLVTHVPPASPLRKAQEPAVWIRQVWSQIDPWLGPGDKGLVFASPQPENAAPVFVVVPPGSTFLARTNVHMVRVCRGKDFQSYIGTVVVHNRAERAEVIGRTLGSGSYGLGWLSDKLDKKAKQLPKPGGMLAVTLRPSVHVGSWEVAAFLGHPCMQEDERTGKWQPALNLKAAGSQGVFWKYRQVNAVILGKLDGDGHSFSDIRYASSPLTPSTVCDDLAGALGVQKRYDWNITGQTWDFAEVNGTLPIDDSED